MKRTILLALLVTCGISYAETIDLKQEGGLFVVPVLINGKLTLDFAIDSGASDVSMPADVFSTLTRAGTITTKDLLDKQIYILADGSKQESQRFHIRSLRIGSTEVHDVVASVAPQAGPLLLGQSFLTKLGSWSIDNRRKVLLINESPKIGIKPSLPSSGESPSAHAWKRIGSSDDDKTAYYVDVASIRLSDSIRRVWMRTLHAPHTVRETGDNAKWVSYMLIRMAFNCREETSTVEDTIIYYDDGTFQRKPSANSGSYVTVTPETPADLVMKLVCK